MFVASLQEMSELVLEDVEVEPENLSRIRVTSLSTSDAYKASALEVGSSLVYMHGQDDHATQLVFLPGHKVETFNAQWEAIEFKFPVFLVF